MAKVYKKPAGGRRRVNRDHNGIPQLAAHLCGCSVSMAYKVANKKAKSVKVSRALAEAERQILRAKGQAA